VDWRFHIITFNNQPIGVHLHCKIVPWIEADLLFDCLLQTEAGAHVDAVNEKNQTPLDIAGVSVTATILKINQKISLKCLAAQVKVSWG